MNCELTSDERMRVKRMRRWVKNELEFEGRSDEDYVLLYLRSCDFNLELSKTTFRMYYENQERYSEWLTNRDVQNPNLSKFLQMRYITALIETDVHQPSITIIKGERMNGCSTNFDDMCKVIGLALETVARRRSCQLSGNIILMDFANCPWWLVRKLLWPSVCKALLNAFLFGIPVKTEILAVVNSPLIAKAVLAICEPFFTPGFRHKVHLISDWSKISSVVSIDRLPTAVGGTSGPIKHHEDSFIQEVTRMNEELMRDNDNFGFKLKGKS